MNEMISPAESSCF